jgi:hypothetical protein
MSIMDGYHTAILVAKREGGNVRFNIFDQFGSFIDGARRDWYDDSEVDAALLAYVRGGRTIRRRVNGNNVDIQIKTETTIYLFKKRNIPHENE